MSVLAAAIISCFSIVLLTWHLSRSSMQRIAGYAMYFDVILHGGVIYLFMGTSTLGLLQAELSAIFITCMLRAYRHLHGYQRFERMRWVTYAGMWTKPTENDNAQA